MTKVEMFEELHNEKAEIVKQERVKVCDKIHHEVAIFLTRIGCNWKTNEDCGRWDGRITLINPHSDNEWDHANIEIRINDKYAEDYSHVDHRELTISSTGWSSIKFSDAKVIEYYKTLAKVLESLNTLETALNEIDYTALEHAREEMYAVGRELEAEKKTVKEAEKAAKVAEITPKLVAGADLVMNAKCEGRRQYTLKIEKVTAKMLYLNNYSQRKIAEVVECIINGDIKFAS